MIEPEITTDSNVESSSSNSEKLCSSKIPLLPTPSEIVAMLSRRVIGHEQAKRDIAVAAYNFLLQCASSDLYGGRVEPNHLMLAGPTGSGKSLLFRTLGKILRVPTYFFSCTDLTPNGYKGQSLTDCIDELSPNISDDGYTHPAIVVWDEADKLRDDGTMQGSYKRTVQQEFLTFLDGTACDSASILDSSRVLNIACGAFVGLAELRGAATKPEIGFQPMHKDPRDDRPRPPAPLRPDDLIAYGLIPEFVGRFSCIAELDPLDQNVMRRILIEAEDNALARRKAYFDIHRIRLEFTDAAIDAVVAQAMVHQTGARSLRLVLDHALRGVEYRLPELAQKGVTALIYNENSALGLTPPKEETGAICSDLDYLFELRKKAASYSKAKAISGDSDEMIIF